MDGPNLRLSAVVDWQAPWFEPWRARGQRVAQGLAANMAVAQALNAEPAAPVRFTPAATLPAGSAYERHVFETGHCPTRDNLHDFLNGLCWLEFPRAKTQLNRLQAFELERAGVSGQRGPVRDAVTVFDENGALLHAPAPLWEALIERDWPRLFIELRPLWAQARLLVFGHALLEKLVRPRKELTAHVWRLPCPAASAVEIDEWLAGELTPPRLAAKPFTPLPLMGIPGWCAENQNFSFYDDSLVFRRPAGRTSFQQHRPPGT